MLRTLLFTALLGIVFFVVEYFGWPLHIHPRKWFILAFFLSLSLLQHRVLENGFRNQREKFVQFYLATIVIRLLLSLGFVGAFLYIGTTQIESFIITFFALYIFYTCFEIYGLYSNLRRDLKS
jgi:nitrate reductase NapE component